MSAPTVEHVDPKTLVIEANVRTAVNLDPDFLNSVKQVGVLVPVLVHRTADTLRVRAGQRRTLAAIETGRETIPAYVVDGDDDVARRIIEQFTENHHREALTAADDAAVFEQLSLLGMSAAAIAKRTSTKKARVEKGLTVAGSATAKAVTAKYDLTLDQAAVLAEFDGDDEAVKALTVTAIKEPERFEHVTQQLRDKRAEVAAVAALTETLTAEGWPVIDRPPYDDNANVELHRLATLDGEEKVELTPETHTTCPGKAVWISTNYGDPRPVYVCIDPNGNGHVSRYSYGAPARQSGPMSEEQKTERRTLIANNKAWKSAETVRRDWLTTFAGRKTAPKDASTYLAGVLAGGHHSLKRAAEQGHTLARALLGLDRTTGYGDRALVDLVAAANPARAQVIALVLVLAGIEENTSTNTWRNPSTEDRAYLTALSGWGYGLSEVETLATAVPTYAARVEDGPDEDGSVEEDYPDDEG